MLLILFVLAMLGLWMLPVFLMGYPYSLSLIIHTARNLSETGVLDNSYLRLTGIIAWLVHPLLSWDNLIGWTAVSAAGFALALLPWWWSVRQLFDVRVAWLSTVILALMPLYWVEALDLGGYSFALFFLFLCFAFFIKFFPQRRITAMIICGICFGAVLGSHYTFVTFLPWFVLAFIWHERRHLLRALLNAGIFCGVAYIAFALPLLPNALQPGMSAMERVVVFLPPLSGATPGIGHIYPDEYIFMHYRDEYDATIKERVADESFFGQQEDRHYRLIFGVGDFNIIDKITTGTWLFLNSLSSLVMQETIGGAFLWLFILPGIVILWKRNRALLLYILGLWLSMEFFVRFVLNFGRLHLNDIGWVLALFAGVGASFIVATLTREWAPKRSAILAVVMALIISLQLIQANRKLLAFHYSRSYVPEVYAAAEALQSVPGDAIVANPRRSELFFFSPHTSVNIHAPTIDFLAERGELAKPFIFYGVTHILGYNQEQTRQIIQAVPEIKVVSLPAEPPAISVTPFIRYLLHLVR
ncbi:MAG: glycosyltransferase family 39 protein [Candidatus Peribacteraceae bacterium]